MRVAELRFTGGSFLSRICEIILQDFLYGTWRRYGAQVGMRFEKGMCVSTYSLRTLRVALTTQVNIEVGTNSGGPRVRIQSEAPDITVDVMYFSPPPSRMEPGYNLRQRDWLRTARPRGRISIPRRVKNILHGVQTGCGAHPPPIRWIPKLLTN
jgi:hypothetical protein